MTANSRPANDGSTPHCDTQDDRDRKQAAERAIRDSERLYRAIGESIDYGIWVCDPNGRTIYVSNSFLKLVGLTLEEASGLGWTCVLHPDDVERTIAGWNRCVEAGSAWNMEHRFLGVDGQYHPILARGVPVRDDDGRVICWAGINLDISDVKSATAHAHEQTRMLDRVLRVNADLTGQLDVEAILAATITAAVEIVGASFDAFFEKPSEDKASAFVLDSLSSAARERLAAFPIPRGAAPFALAFAGQTVRFDDLTSDARHEQLLPLADQPVAADAVRSLLAVPVISRRGQVLGALVLGHRNASALSEKDEFLVRGVVSQAVVALDNAQLHAAAQREINERRMIEHTLRRVNGELRERNADMAQFVYTVSHDLKSPIVTTMGFVGMLKEDIAAERKAGVFESIEHIERATSHMNQLIDDLLHLSRVGYVDLKLEEVDLSALGFDVASEFSLRLQNAGAVLTVQPNMPHISADRGRLMQVLDNLVSNAIKYGDRADLEIAIGSTTVDDEVRLFVRDNGPGIASEYHKKIFGLFQRLDSRREGTGVGLAIVARIMQLHGGRAWVESMPGNGATFWIAFPPPRE